MSEQEYLDEIERRIRRFYLCGRRNPSLSNAAWCATIKRSQARKTQSGQYTYGGNMREEFDFSGMSEEEKAAYYEMMEEYFDSDEFLEEPWMQELKKEFEREKTVVLNIGRIKEVMEAKKLIEEIIKMEGIDGEIEYCSDDIQQGIVALNVIADEWEFSNSKYRQTRALFRQVIDLADGMLIMPRTDGKLNIDFTFHRVSVELK